MTAGPSARRPAGSPGWGRRLLAPIGGVVTRLRERLRPAIAQAVRRWRGMAVRERRQVLLMLVVVAAALLWLLFTRPALDTLSHWRQEMPRLRSQAAALEQVLADAGGPRALAAMQTLPPAQRVAASLDQAGLADTYEIETRNGSAELAILFKRPVEAGPLVAWLLVAPAGQGMAVGQATLRRAEAHGPDAQAGRVHADVTLTVRRQGPGNGT